MNIHNNQLSMGYSDHNDPYYGLKSVTIVDAKKSGLTCEEIRSAIAKLANKELNGERGIIRPSDYVRNEYFSDDKQSQSGMGFPEMIGLATFNNNIIGFIITEKRRESKNVYNSKKTYFTSNTDYVAYIAVDSASKKSGVGTKLMFAAMRKTKENGKRYLTLTYTAEHSGDETERCKARIEFYNSFNSRFGIPVKERGNDICSGRLSVRPFYDLQSVDINSLL